MIPRDDDGPPYLADGARETAQQRTARLVAFVRRFRKVAMDHDFDVNELSEMFDESTALLRDIDGNEEGRDE